MTTHLSLAPAVGLPSCRGLIVAMTAAFALAASPVSVGKGNSTRFVPSDTILSHVPACGDATWEDPCRIDLSNGSFDGPPGDSYRHEDFSWISVSPRHRVEAHIVPWTYRADGDTGWTRREAGLRFELEKPGDAIWRWVALPPLKDARGRRVNVPVEYAVRARFGGVPAGARVSVILSARRGGEVLTEVSATETSRSATVLPGGRVETSIPFPAEWSDADLGIAIAYDEGGRPVEIDDVVVMRHTGDGLGDTPVE